MQAPSAAQRKRMMKFSPTLPTRSPLATPARRLLAALALGLCFGAYATEVFRGALLAIPKGQREAGLALGLSAPRIFWRITLPQLWRTALPGLGNLYMILLKDTALVSLISLEELMRKAGVASNATKEPFTFYMSAAVIYLGLTALVMLALHLLEKRAGRGFARNEL